MPPRFAFWTIIIDDAPTAFRARDRADLIPTLRQLQGRNPTATIRWFSQGKLWESPEAARAARCAPKQPRGPDWRPGGRHEDPRARFRMKVHPAAKGDEAERDGANERRGAEGAVVEGRTDRDRRRRPERMADNRGKGAKRTRGKGRPDRKGTSSDPRQTWKHRERARWPRPKGAETPATSETPSEPEAPPPEPPPGPDRPPKPGHEPGPDVPNPETIRILPEPPERAGKT
jgi:hypothetical protein